MTKLHAARLDRALQTLPQSYPGPGGAVAVLHEGKVLVRHAWGWANAERRIAFTPRTLFRMCSITKQFTCGLLLSTYPDPSALDGDVRARLPQLSGQTPSTLQLCHNQSGLRDQWAVAMLLGSPAEMLLDVRGMPRRIDNHRTLQFSAGTRYSYCNDNFKILSDILEDRGNRGFADLLGTCLLERIGMETAFLAADTRVMPDGTIGYEGSQATGFRLAENRMVGIGEAGLCASLDDMIAWERHIDATRDDDDGLYRRLSGPVHFTDGHAAAYGFGLGRSRDLGRLVTGHGGALRGWRSHRLHVRSERISVVVLFNHPSNVLAAALCLLAAVLDHDLLRPDPSIPAPHWLGDYLEPETGLAIGLDTPAAGQVRLRYGHSAERLDLQQDGSAGRDGTRVCIGDGGLWMHRPQDNQASLLQPCRGTPNRNIEGTYRCEETGADLTIMSSGGALYGGFSGAFGQGRMELLAPVDANVWTLPCWRALDYTPPGDWTLAIIRNANGRVEQVKVGCRLARGFCYVPTRW